MNKPLSWHEKYILALNEYLSLRDIQKLRSVGQPTAIIIRKEVTDYCIKNKIPLQNEKVPTDVVFEVTGRNLEFYYTKMKLEFDASQYIISVPKTNLVCA